MHIIGQITPPTDGDNAWMWLSGILVGAIGILWKQHSDSKSAENTSLRAERDKERERNDILLTSIPELVTVMKEIQTFFKTRPPE